MKHTGWSGKTDGLPWMQRTLIVWLRYVDVRVLYAVMALVIPFYVVFDHRARRACWDYLRRRQAMSPLRAAVGVYCCEYNLGRVVLDRFAAYAGRHFALTVEGHDAWAALSQGQQGFLQVSAHVGNFELTGYELSSERKTVHTLVYGGETETMMRNRERMLAGHNVRMIPVSDDMSHLFALSNALRDGDIVSMPGDRLFGSAKAVACRFLGAEARFPLGPFALAVQREAPVVVVFTMKEGAYRYRTFVRRLDYAPGLSGRRQMEHLCRQYADCLAEVIGRYPYQWYNFYDFWDNPS